MGARGYRDISATERDLAGRDRSNIERRYKMVDFKSHRAEINKVKQQLANPNLSYHRRRDLKRYLGRLHKEMSEAKKWSKAV